MKNRLLLPLCCGALCCLVLTANARASTHVDWNEVGLLGTATLPGVSMVEPAKRPEPPIPISYDTQDCLESVSPMFRDLWDRQAYKHISYNTSGASGINGGRVSIFFIVCTGFLPGCSASIVCVGGGATSGAVVCSGSVAGCSGAAVCSFTPGACSGALVCSGLATACSGAATGCSGGAVACSGVSAACSGGAVACSGGSLACSGGGVVCSGNAGVCSGAVACSLNVGVCSGAGFCSANLGFCSGSVVFCSLGGNICSGSVFGCSVNVAPGGIADEAACSAAYVCSNSDGTCSAGAICSNADICSGAIICSAGTTECSTGGICTYSDVGSTCSTAILCTTHMAGCSGLIDCVLNPKLPPEAVPKREPVGMHRRQMYRELKVQYAYSDLLSGFSESESEDIDMLTMLHVGSNKNRDLTLAP